MLQVIADVPIFEPSGRDHTQMLDERIVAFNRALVNAGAWVLAEGLRGSGSAVTVRFENGSGPTASDGPFADRDEQLVGFWIIKAQGIDEAVGWARNAPVSSGAIEVRPLISGGPAIQRELRHERNRSVIGDDVSQDSQQEI